MTDRRRLVFVSPRFLFPTDSGGKIRTTQILRGLKGGAFDVTLVMPATPSQRSDWTEDIDSVCDEHVSWRRPATDGLLATAKKASGVLNRYPIPVIADRDQRGVETVARVLAAGPDLVVFDFPHSAVLAPRQIDLPSVMFTHNVEAEIFERHAVVAKTPLHRWLWQNQFRKMRRFESETLNAFDTVIAVSERDCEFFRREYGARHCGAIPTGVDTEFFSYRAPKDELQVVFCGSMDWMANIDGIRYFANEVWPLVRDRVPAARMKVVGRAPPESLVRRILAIAPGWEFTGFVDDVREHIGGAAAFVIPLRVGGGTRIKAFEAMAIGTPVVSTSVGIEGLPVIDGEHFFRADTAQDFAARISELLESPDRREAVSLAARRLVEDRFDFRVAASVFERLCLETLDRGQRN